jgi:hypothetical protein
VTYLVWSEILARNVDSVAGTSGASVILLEILATVLKYSITTKSRDVDLPVHTVVVVHRLELEAAALQNDNLVGNFEPEFRNFAPALLPH